MNKLTPEEALILNLLVKAWERFQKLEEIHPWDGVEFMYLMHQAQRFLLARPMQKAIIEEEEKRSKNGPKSKNGQGPTRST